MAGTDRKSETDPQDAAPRWRRRAADRPREILDAALTVFVEKGFAATKLDDVAVAAGISKGLLYRYFDNKAELFKEVIRQTLVTTIRDVGDRARASDSAVAALDVFLDQMIASPMTRAAPQSRSWSSANRAASPNSPCSILRKSSARP